MSSPKEDETAAAAQQVGSMSLGESTKRKGESNEENYEDPTKMCSACGKKSDTTKKGTACKCVNYCDKECQNKHWKEHKNECKRIKKILGKRGGKLDLGEELDVGPLPDVPTREECHICMQSLPIHAGLQSFSVCCGKTICGGCNYQHQMKSGEPITCAFCRTPVSESDEEILAQLRKRVEGKDPEALINMGMCYGRGAHGLPVNHAKCIELLRESADLGCPSAQYRLGNSYKFGEMGLEQNEEEGIKYWEKAAEGGHLLSRHNLGCNEADNDNDVAAMRHWRLSASGGDRKSMKQLIDFFEEGLLHHGDLAAILENFYHARNEMTSVDRDEYIAYLKRAGEYEAVYEC